MTTYTPLIDWALKRPPVIGTDPAGNAIRDMVHDDPKVKDTYGSADRARYFTNAEIAALASRIEEATGKLVTFRPDTRYDLSKDSMKRKFFMVSIDGGSEVEAGVLFGELSKAGVDAPGTITLTDSGVRFVPDVPKAEAPEKPTPTVVPPGYRISYPNGFYGAPVIEKIPDVKPLTDRELLEAIARKVGAL